MSNNNKGETADRTWLATLTAIVGVIPGLFAASVVVMLYTFFLRPHVEGHGIPFLEDVALVWFPEFLRGGVTGGVAIWLAQWRNNKADFRVARYAALAFWGATLLLLVTLNVGLLGTLDIVAGVAFLAGLGFGLWASEMT